jgi:hypothetical protein
MRLFVAALLVVSIGCQKKQCDAARSRVELHDGSGATTLSWKGDDLCDGELKRIASIETGDGKVTLKEPNGRLRLELTKESPEVAVAKDDGGPHLRVIRSPSELRVQRGDGVPYGFVVPEGKTGAAVYNPGSSPLGKVAMRDRDAVVTDMAGTALTYVIPASDPALAGVFGIPHLDPAEQLAIYIYWSR